MDIAMIGSGYVGLVSGACFSEFGVNVTCVDKDAAKIDRLRRGEIPIYEPGLEALVAGNVQAGRLRFSTDLTAAVKGMDAVFIAVGTPSRRGDGHADLSYVFAAAKEIAEAMDGYTVVVNKSTVPVGTGDEVERLIRQFRPDTDFDVVSNPEFLREGSAINDFMRPDRVVIGTDSERAREVMRQLYRVLYLIETPIVFTSRTSSELIKYAANAFLATKITFINEMADLCERVGADVHDVARGIGLDGRIGRKFLHAGPGYGGSCFPKDTLALTRTARDAGSPVRIIETVVDINDRRKQHMAEKIIATCGGSVAGKTIAVLGLTFKPNTDDMRDAPSLGIVPALQQAGAQVRAFDPEGMHEAKALLQGVTWCDDAYGCLEDADAVAILTEWNEFRALDLDRVKSLLKAPVMVDLRNVYEPAEMAAAGFTYVSVGRPILAPTSGPAARTVVYGPARMHPSILREYDIRGIVGDTLTVEDVYAVGRAFATLARKQDKQTVAVGYDGRLTSPLLERTLVDGLVDGGMTVHRIGLAPTPMLYFATKYLGADAGMSVTGSHNPPEYNGIKMTLGGRSFFGGDIQALGRLARSGEFVSGRGRWQDAAIDDAYVARLAQDAASGRPLSVAWDPGNGAAAAVLQKLCRNLPGRHVLINDRVDGRFPAHHPDPTVEANLAQLKEVVASEGCDLGIALDGDGDRIGVVDHLGRVLWGDQLLVILAGPVLADCPGATVIADVKSSQVFFDEITRMGGQPVMSRTGHSLIKSLMAETGAPLAGEMSGHIFFAHRYYGFDDALYAAVRLLAILAGSDRSLADMKNALPVMVNTPEIRIDCPDDRKFAVIDEVRARLRDNANSLRVDEVDGVRVTGPDGWWLLRASNTQPVLVGRCEAADGPGLDRQVAALAQELRASGVTTAADFAGPTG
ncbi:MAG: nucleotide sugar dehydrogenase [Rhodospirillales bacterium]|nr:MAG: nucleotide sugar dehydrogenase [Rhodospirillales bacterium]